MRRDRPTVRWFGPARGALVEAWSPAIDTPEGVLCIGCGEVVDDGEYGFALPFGGDLTDLEDPSMAYFVYEAGVRGIGPLHVVYHGRCLARMIEGDTPSA